MSNITTKPLSITDAAVTKEHDEEWANAHSWRYLLNGVEVACEFVFETLEEAARDLMAKLIQAAADHIEIEIKSALK